ncbi:MAG: protein kinase [Planctomycetota bacterium]|nr:protein kinase [Planctomycetota bacterium]MCX8040229.1 protein kinase [Planctomycetota bacterium]MDW8372476.1 protein kinase [Planctomycetota bacterium]
MPGAEPFTDSSTITGVPSTERLRRRTLHAAAFEAVLKETFLAQGIQLIEPLAAASKETVVYGANYHGEQVAVKIYVPAVDEIEEALSSFGAFKVECEKTMILSRRSPHVLQVLEYGDAELPRDLPDELVDLFPLRILPFMVTERAAFGSLDKIMRRSLPGFDRWTLLETLCAATEGIHEAHLHQVVHRDIKPQNILVFAPGKGKIADFGIARWRTRRVNRESVLLTPKYASPEQAFYALTGEHEQLVEVRGDIYSWAIMVYELVTGRHPFAWAIRAAAGADLRTQQRNLLKAIAANDRRGFAATGDITFDALIDTCTTDLKRRISDISLANRVLRQFVARMRQQAGAGGQ